MARTRRTLGNSLAPPRFLMFLALFAAVTGTLCATGAAFRESLMCGFDAAAAIFLVSLWPLLNNGSPDSIRRHAAENDAILVSANTSDMARIPGIRLEDWSVPPADR